jgi:hypothetical protein
MARKLRIGAVSHRVPWCVAYDGDKCQECGDVNALPVVNERLGGLTSGALGGIPPRPTRVHASVLKRLMRFGAQPAIAHCSAFALRFAGLGALTHESQ